MAAEAPIVIRLREVVKDRARGGTSFRLRVPELTVRAGEFLAVVGESGCGKSTLLDMLGLVLQPTAAAEFAYRDPATGAARPVAALAEGERAAIRRSMLGYVLQTGGLLPFLDVRDNILLTCRMNGQSGRAAAVDELCARLKISNQLAKMPRHLSGGQRQRVAIARALAHRPPIVLADEPTAAVDKLTAREIRDTFRELTRASGVAVVMVTHDLALIEGVADRRVVFDLHKPSPEETVSTVREDRS
jgi:putative ABC transport system ATP-binding protein